MCKTDELCGFAISAQIYISHYVAKSFLYEVESVDGIEQAR